MVTVNDELLNIICNKVVVKLVSQSGDHSDSQSASESEKQSITVTK